MSPGRARPVPFRTSILTVGGLPGPECTGLGKKKTDRKQGLPICYEGQAKILYRQICFSTIILRRLISP